MVLAQKIRGTSRTIALYNYLDIELLRLYRNTPDGPKRQRMLGRLCHDNFALVHRLTQKYTNYSEVHHEYDDAFQAGCIGLLTAIRRFDLERGTRFSTYAAFWIRYEIQRKCLVFELPICRPLHAGKPYKILRAEEAHESRTGETAQAEDLGVSRAQMERWADVVFSFCPLTTAHEETEDYTPGALASLEASQWEVAASKALALVTEAERAAILTDRATPEMLANIRERVQR